MAHYADPDGERLVEGFPDIRSARLYACRRVRSSVEALRKPGQSDGEHRRLWSLFGEDCAVLGGDWSGHAHLDGFLAAPARGFQIDWSALTPRTLRNGRSVLETLDWRWPEPGADDDFQVQLTLSATALQWRERYGEHTQSVLDFVQYGRPGLVKAPPETVMAELATALGVDGWPWQRALHAHEEAWHAAAREGALAGLEQLRAIDPGGLDRPLPTGMTPVQTAVRWEQAIAADWLLRHGADASQCNRTGTPLLVTAAQTHQWAAIHACLQAGAERDATDAGGLNALAYAVLNWRPQDAARQTPALSLLLSAGADPGFVLPGHGIDLRAWALSRGQPALCALLGAVAPPPIGPPPPAASGQRAWIELSLQDRFTTSSGAPGGEQRWKAWAEIPAEWSGADDRARDHWLLAPLRRAYAHMSEAAGSGEGGGSYQLLQLRSRLLPAAEVAQRPWSPPGQTVYVVADAASAARLAPRKVDA